MCSDLAWDDLDTLLIWVDKENSMEFLLFSVHYLYNYYMVCALLSHTYHVTYHVTSCNVIVTMWYLWHDTFLHSSYVISPKETKKKRNINNDLAILPSYDTWFCCAWCCYWKTESLPLHCILSFFVLRPWGFLCFLLEECCCQFIIASLQIVAKVRVIALIVFWL